MAFRPTTLMNACGSGARLEKSQRSAIQEEARQAVLKTLGRMNGGSIVMGSNSAPLTLKASA